MAKFALLIGVSEYEPGLNPLPGSVLDVDALRRVLVHPDMGGFAEADITTLKNPQRQEMEDAIYRLFADRKKDDLLLLYFSGHGIKDLNNGKFYLSTRTTRYENGSLVIPSAVAATYLHDRINDSRSQCQVIILDCCFSGAIAQGMTVKDDGNVDIKAVLGGRGRAILTSSTSVEYSFGSDGSGYADSGLSVYTRFLVEGIETGTADMDGDGWISVEELHEYASRQVKTVSPAMTPRFYPVEEGYKIILAKSPQNDPKLNYRKEVQKRAKQGGGTFSVFAHRILEDKRREWGLSPEAAEAIQTEVLQPYRDYEQKLQNYEQALREAATDEYPFSPQTEKDLQEYRQHLNLKAEDWQAIETRVLTPFVQTSEQVKVNPIPPQATPSSPPVSPPTNLPPSLTAEELFNRALAEELFNRALEQRKAGDNQRAIADYTEAIRLQPDFAEAYKGRGAARSDLGDKPGAIADCNEAIRLKPDFADAYYNRGLAKSTLGDYKGAIADFTEAIRLQPNDTDAYIFRGLAKSVLGDKEGAIVDLTEAIRLQPDYATAYYNRGLTKSTLGDKPGAIADFTEAIRLKPDYAAAYMGRGIAKYYLDDQRGAIADYTEAIRLKPDYANAYYGCGVVKSDLGDKPGAIVDFTEAIRLKPDFANAYYYRGNAKSDLGDKPGAIADFTEAIRLKPNDTAAYNNRGNAKSDLGDKLGAIADYNEAIRLQPDYATAYFGRGNAKYDSGDKPGAIADYDEAIQLQSDFAAAYNNRGNAKRALGDKEGAIADFTEAIRLKPDYADAYYNRGNAKYALGDRQGAIADYQQAARLYQLRGNTERCRNALNQIEKLEKENKGFWGRLFS